jgi:molybdopterin synthase catalytic subunit
MDTGALPGNQDFVEVSERPIDPGALASLVGRNDAGAVVVFLGTVRDHSEGRSGVTGLEYEAYEGVVEGEIASIVAEARGRWELGAVAAVHRLGRLGVAEVTVGVAVSAPHRPEAFDAARFLIDQLKSRAPIWKKELWADGEEWV